MGYVLSYAKFTYRPANDYLMLAVKQYSSSKNPFFKLDPFKDFTSTGSDIDSFIIGYYNNTGGGGVTYNADVLMINATFGSCPDG